MFRTNILFSLTILILSFSSIYGQESKTPKNLKRAVHYLNRKTSDSLKSLIIASDKDNIKKVSYPWGGEFRTVFDWTSSDNWDARIVEYLNEKGVSKHQEEVILLSFKEYLQHKQFDEDAILEPFQKLELKWAEEDKIRFTTDTLRGVYIPIDLYDCFKTLDNMYSDSLKVEITWLTEEDYLRGNYRGGIGLWMRNNWQLWGGSRLTKFFRENHINHPESMSVVLLQCYHRHLCQDSIRFDEEVLKYIEYDKIQDEEEAQKELEDFLDRKETIANYLIGDTLEYSYNYGYASKSQENKWFDDECLVTGVLIEKDTGEFRLKVKVINSCDRKGIVIYDNVSTYYYDPISKTSSRPKKRKIEYLKKGKSDWFMLDDWFKYYD